MLRMYQFICRFCLDGDIYKISDIRYVSYGNRTDKNVAIIDFVKYRLSHKKIESVKPFFKFSKSV